MDHLCYLCLVFVMLSRLFIAASWTPAGKLLTSWLLFVTSYCDFVTFPCGILSQVWYLLVLIPDLCPHPYFENACWIAALLSDSTCVLKDWPGDFDIKRRDPGIDKPKALKHDCFYNTDMLF